jgi:hypothetical protein
MKNSLPIATTLAILISGGAWGDATVTYTVPEGQSGELPNKAFVQDGKVLIKDAGDANTDMIFDPGNSTMYLIDHSTSTYMELNEETIMSFQEQASGMRALVEQQLQGIPPEQRAQMEQMMQNMGINTAAPVERPVPTLEEIGNTNYSGFECSEQRVMEGAQQIATVCLSLGNNLGLSEADYQTLLGMQNFTFRLASQAKELASQMGNSMPNFSGASLDTLIIQGSDESGGSSSSMNISGVEDDELPEGTTSIPGGYSAKDMPGLEDLM